MPHRLAVLVATPAHSSIRGPLSYRSELPLAPGTLVRVPLGRREVLGLVWERDPAQDADRLEMEEKPILGALEDIPPLTLTWRQLVTFAANYYQRSVGEVALAALPPQLRGLSALQLARRLRRKPAAASQHDAPPDVTKGVALTPEQAQALDGIAAHPGPFLLSTVPPAAARPRCTCRLCRPSGRQPAGAGAGDGARDQPDAPAGIALHCAVWRRCRGIAAQRHDEPAAPEKLAGRAHRRCTHRAGHAHGGVCVPAAFN
jgi:hypothetical protein